MLPLQEKRQAPPRPLLQSPPRRLEVLPTTEVLQRVQRECRLFSDFSGADLAAFAQLCSPQPFLKGELLLKQGEIASWFGVLLSGSVVAFLQDEGDEEVPLGIHHQGEFLGLVRCIQWERSIARPFSVRALEDGVVAVVMYDHLQDWQIRHPTLHFALLRAMLGRLVDIAAGFFTGCPLSASILWPIVSMSDERLLDHLLQLNYAGRLPSRASGVLDYDTMVALARRLRVARWEAHGVVSRCGMPAVAAFLVLQGKLMGQAPGSENEVPPRLFEEGDIACLEAVVGAERGCALDVVATCQTLVAIILPEDATALAKELPDCATKLLQCLHLQFLRDMVPQSAQAMLLMAEGAASLQLPPEDAVGAVAAQPLSCPRGVPPIRLRDVIRMAESTRLASGGGSAYQSHGHFLVRRFLLAGQKPMAHLVPGWAEGMDPSLEMNEGARRRAAGEAPARRAPRPSSAPLHVRRSQGMDEQRRRQLPVAAAKQEWRRRPCKKQDGSHGVGVCSLCGKTTTATAAAGSKGKLGASMPLDGSTPMADVGEGQPDLKLASQAALIERLRARVAELEQVVHDTSAELAKTSRERDEWRTKATYAM